MRFYHLLLAPAVLLEGIGSSAAFQLPRRNIAVAAPKSKSKSNILPRLITGPKDGLLTKLSSFKIPAGSNKKLRSRPSKNQKKLNEISNKQILALVTTSCLACLVRPTVARAAFVDPTVLTYDEVPGLGILTNGVVPGMYKPDIIDKMVRRAFTFVASAIVASGALLVSAALARSAYVGDMNSDPSQQQEMPVDDAVETSQAKHVNWNEYSHVLLGLLQRKAKNHVDTTADDEEAKLQKANLFFQEQKNKLHQRQARAPRSKLFESRVYLENLSKHSNEDEDMEHDILKSYSTWGAYKQQLAKSQEEKVKMNEINERLQIMKNLITWEDYNQLVNELQDKKIEVNVLKRELENLKSMLQIEQSLHQAESIHQVQREKLPSQDSTTDDELEAFDKKAQEFDETMKESIALTNETYVDDLGSGIR